MLAEAKILRPDFCGLRRTGPEKITLSMMLMIFLSDLGILGVRSMGPDVSKTPFARGEMFFITGLTFDVSI